MVTLFIDGPLSNDMGPNAYFQPKNFPSSLMQVHLSARRFSLIQLSWEKRIKKWVKARNYNKGVSEKV